MRGSLDGFSDAINALDTCRIFHVDAMDTSAFPVDVLFLRYVYRCWCILYTSIYNVDAFVRPGCVCHVYIVCFGNICGCHVLGVLCSGHVCGHCGCLGYICG